MGDARIRHPKWTPHGKGKQVDVNHGALGRGSGIAITNGGA
jgi:hypothetical protein